jgi:osmotically-inducible protein OsmY
MLGNKLDAEIKENVIRELRWDPRVDETQIGVEVKQGVVTLTGFVSGWGKKEAAAKAAHRVQGVLDVANDLEIQLEGSEIRTDSDIAAAVRTALEWDVFVPDDRIRSTVSDGIVTLSGNVNRLTQKTDAERAIRNLQCVRAVVNEIEVSFKADAENVRRSIQAALERYAIREAKGISTSVQDGVVTLSGTVRSWQERRAVIGAAQGTRGVRRVEDDLRIDLGTTLS